MAQGSKWSQSRVRLFGACSPSKRAWPNSEVPSEGLVGCQACDPEMVEWINGATRLGLVRLTCHSLSIGEPVMVAALRAWLSLRQASTKKPAVALPETLSPGEDLQCSVPG
jgi:hypothetical protein